MLTILFKLHCGTFIIAFPHQFILEILHPSCFDTSVSHNIKKPTVYRYICNIILAGKASQNTLTSTEQREKTTVALNRAKMTTQTSESLGGKERQSAGAKEPENRRKQHKSISVDFWQK